MSESVDLGMFSCSAPSDAEQEASPFFTIGGVHVPKNMMLWAAVGVAVWSFFIRGK